MAYPDTYTPSTAFDGALPGVPLGVAHREAHEELAAWVPLVESHVGRMPSVDPLALGYYATRQPVRNWVDNGNFEVAQSGAGPFTTSGVVGLDRHSEVAETSTFSTTRQALAPGVLLEGSYEHPAPFYRRVVVSGGGTASSRCLSVHRIEGVGSLAGQNVTLSFWARTGGGGAPTIGVSLGQYFGTGGSPSPTLAFGASGAVLASAWRRYTFFYSVPSIAGKTIGTNGDDALNINLWYDAGSTFAASEGVTIGNQSGTFDTTNICLHKGWLVADYEDVPRPTMLARCQRWRYVTPTAGNLSPVGQAYSTDNAMLVIEHPVRMARVPTLTLAAGPYTNKLTRIEVSSHTPTVIVLNSASVDRSFIRAQCTGALTLHALHALIDTPLTLSCE